MERVGVDSPTSHESSGIPLLPPRRSSEESAPHVDVDAAEQTRSSPCLTPPIPMEQTWLSGRPGTLEAPPASKPVGACPTRRRQRGAVVGARFPWPRTHDLQHDPSCGLLVEVTAVDDSVEVCVTIPSEKLGRSRCGLDLLRVTCRSAPADWGVFRPTSPHPQFDPLADQIRSSGIPETVRSATSIPRQRLTSGMSSSCSSSATLAPYVARTGTPVGSPSSKMPWSV